MWTHPFWIYQWSKTNLEQVIKVLLYITLGLCQEETRPLSPGSSVLEVRGARLESRLLETCCVTQGFIFPLWAFIFLSVRPLEGFTQHRYLPKPTLYQVLCWALGITSELDFPLPSKGRLDQKVSNAVSRSDILWSQIATSSMGDGSRVFDPILREPGHRVLSYTPAGPGSRPIQRAWAQVKRQVST